ncbi:MAG: hypothetical protein FJ405_04895 [Verrucomicrobia bacterium]|nr:hypothetical protein [Verrucomicrobiota bacterium]
MRRFLLASLLLASFLAPRVSSAQDTTPPVLLSATRTAFKQYLMDEDFQLEETNITSLQINVVFSERMRTNDNDPNSVMNRANWHVTTVGGTPAITLSVLDVTLTPVTPRTTSNLTLTVNAPVGVTRDWRVTVSNVWDTADNEIVTTGNTNNRVNLTSREVLVHRNAYWIYADQGYFGNLDHRFYDDSWAQPSFNDLAFGYAKGAFFIGTDGTLPPFANTGLCCNEGEVEISSKTYYFRKEIRLGEGSLFNSVYEMRYMMGDGMVMYLNGKEIYRTNMPANIKPTYDTLATRSGGATFGTAFFTIPTFGDHARAGTNILAVEVHTSVVNDPSLSFGLELFQRYTNRDAGPLLLLTQPQDVSNVLEGTSASFELKPDGRSPFRYQWLVTTTNNVTITNVSATNRVFDLQNVPLAYHKARVFARVTGGTPSSTVVSSNAILTVVPDVAAPSLLSAEHDPAEGGVVLTFSEVMKASTLLDKANYTITNQAGQTIVIGSVSNIDGRSVVLKTTGTPTLTSRWFMTTRNLSDNAAGANPLPADRLHTIGGDFVLLPMISDWRVYQNGTNGPVGTNWTLANYTEVPGWTTERAGFRLDTALPFPIEQNTFLFPTDTEGNRLLTYYFRKTFNFTGSTNGMLLLLDQVVDDGIVVWVNGKIQHRFNMAGTAVPTYTTFASVEVINPIRTNDIRLTLTNLITGVNQVAVELHRRNATTDADAAFGMELRAHFDLISQTIVQPPPTLDITAPVANAEVIRTTSLNITANAAGQAGATITKVEAFDGATKIGEDTTAPYSIDWTTTGATTLGDHNLRVVATDSRNSTTEKTVLVKVVVPPPPTLDITAPANNSDVMQTVTAVINATAAGVSGATIAKVEVFDGGTKIGENTSAPYSVNWVTSMATALGNHTIRVVATDSRAVTTEKSITLRVIAPPPPTIAITAPTAGTKFTVGDSVTINVNAAGQSGATVSKVEFFDGVTKIGEDQSAPYSIGWSTGAAAVGAHNLRAVATDSRNLTAEATVSVTLEAATVVPELKVVINPARTHAVVTWLPANAPGFILESSSSISPANWQAVAGNPASGYNAALNSGSPKFYRLRKP